VPLYAAGDVRRLALYLLVPAVAAAGMTACDKESVQVGFRPEAGASYRYEIKVQSVTTTVLGDEAPDRAVDDVTLQSRDTVLAAAPEEVRVQVVLHRAGSPDRTFQVRFDRAHQLAGVDLVDGLPPEVLGPVGLPAFMPAAATAPPDRPLSPGEKWKIDATPTVPGAGATARLEGTGRLVKVTTMGGRKVASIKAETTVPLSTTTQVEGATVTISGRERTESTANRALADGVVEEATSVTRGTYDLTLSPAVGAGAPVRGSMEVEIRAQTRRLHDEVQKKKS
jgi:hypothetical protein